MNGLSPTQMAFLQYIGDQHCGAIDRGFIDGSTRVIPSLVKRGLLEWRGVSIQITDLGRDTLHKDAMTGGGL